MGLDVYVGTLTRYYAGAWETIVQQTAHASGVPVTVVRPNANEDDAIRDPEILEPAIVAWREGLNAGLKSHLSRRLDWTEGMTPPYFTDKPAWESYSALVVWAAHNEQPGLPLPKVAPDDWTTDAAVQRSLNAECHSRYDHLVGDAELWLPGQFDITFETEDAGGAPVTVGCTSRLLAQLRALNERTWRADAQTISEWRFAGAEPGAPLQDSARFGFAVFIELAALACLHRVPMKLDY